MQILAVNGLRFFGGGAAQRHQDSKTGIGSDDGRIPE